MPFMSPSLTPVEEGLGWLIPLPCVLINESGSGHTQGVREYVCMGGGLKRHGYLGNISVLLRLWLHFFAPIQLVSKDNAFGAMQPFLTFESLCKKMKALISASSTFV